MPKHFVSESQRKAVMTKLKQKGFRQKPMKITAEGKYLRARIIHPSQFQKESFRNIPAGKNNKGGARIIIGRKKGHKITSTQAVLIQK